jgi:chromate transporter
MRDELVRRRGWTDDQTFLDLVGATNLVPGPNSTELAVHLGLRRAGWRGFVAAACGFILPAVAIVLALAVVYERYGQTSLARDLSYGIVPVIVAIVAQATVGLARTAVKDMVLGAIAVGTAAAWLAGVNELLLLVAAGCLGTVWRNRHRLRSTAAGLFVVPLGVGVGHHDPELWRLGWLMLKVGAVLYGSGYVLISFLERDLVEQLGWLTEQQLLDAVAIGQVTPGPVFTTATFVGYQVAGFAGAAVATLAIFAPALVFVALLSRIVPLIRRSPWAGGALDGVNAASLGMMAAAVVRLADTALVDPLTVVVAVAALAVLLVRRPNSVWLVAAGATVGLARHLLG